jgi:hypothetical protein
MDMTTLANPFHVWAELTRGLRDRFVAELGNERPFSPYTAEVLGSLAAMITRCEHMGTLLGRLHENEPKDFDAFVRALEKS